MRLHHLLTLLTHPKWEGYYINLDLHQLIRVYPTPLVSVYQMIMTGCKQSGTQMQFCFQFNSINETNDSSKLTLVAGFLQFAKF